MAAPLHRDLALEVEDLDAFRALALAGELVAAQHGVEDAEIGAPGEIAQRADLGRGEDRVSREGGGGVPPRRVTDVGERVVADVGRRQAEAERERYAAVHDQLPTEVAVGLLID